MYKSCRHNALRADMLVRPYGWFANINGASGYGCTPTILFQQPHDATTPSGCACHPSEGGELACADIFGAVEKVRHRTNPITCAIWFWFP